MNLFFKVGVLILQAIYLILFHRQLLLYLIDIEIHLVDLVLKLTCLDILPHTALRSVLILPHFLLQVDHYLSQVLDLLILFHHLLC